MRLFVVVTLAALALVVGACSSAIVVVTATPTAEPTPTPTPTPEPSTPSPTTVGICAEYSRWVDALDEVFQDAAQGFGGLSFEADAEQIATHLENFAANLRALPTPNPAVGELAAQAYERVQTLADSLDRVANRTLQAFRTDDNSALDAATEELGAATELMESAMFSAVFAKGECKYVAG